MVAARASCRLPSLVVLGLLVSSACALSADDEQDGHRRLEFMRAAVESLVPESSELKSKAALTAAPKPLLRYSDPTRGGVKEPVNVLVDGGVWRLGAEGRPTALVTVELYQAPNGSRVLAYEFLSLTEAKFSLKHKTERVRWDATGSALELKELPDAPKPAATPTARLAQMRQLVRRFAATERYMNESVDCRLIAQPIDRYHSDAEKIADGAIFAFANGTNPEIGVVFESDGDRWRYGVLRFSSTEMTVTLDGRQVAAFEHYNARGRTDGPYHNAAYKLETGK
jgi:hypothetical protein